MRSSHFYSFILLILFSSALVSQPKWNFQKYLVDKKGTIVSMFPSRVKPTDKLFIEKVESLLGGEAQRRGVTTRESE